MKKLFFILASVATLSLFSCSNKNDPAPTPAVDQRDAFVGTYLLSVAGPIDIDVHITGLYENTFTYNADFKDLNMSIIKDADDANEVDIIVKLNDMYSDTISAEVANGRLIIDNSDIDLSLADIVDAMGLSSSIAALVKSYVGDAHLEIELTHSRAELNNGVLTCTTTISSEAETTTVNLVSVSGVVTDTAIKQ